MARKETNLHEVDQAIKALEKGVRAIDEYLKAHPQLSNKRKLPYSAWRARAFQLLGPLQDVEPTPAALSKAQGHLKKLPKTS